MGGRTRDQATRLGRGSALGRRAVRSVAGPAAHARRVRAARPRPRGTRHQPPACRLTVDRPLAPGRARPRPLPNPMRAALTLAAAGAAAALRAPFALASQPRPVAIAAAKAATLNLFLVLTFFLARSPAFPLAPTLFRHLWAQPASLVAFVLSSAWYKDAADAALADRRGRSSARPAPSTATSAAAEAYRQLLFGVFFLQAALARRLPCIGPALAAFITSLAYGLFSFDAVWAAAAWPVQARVAALERGWPYYAAFGFVAASPSFLLPAAEGGAAVGALYTLFVVAATVAPELHSRPDGAVCACAGGCARAGAPADRPPPTSSPPRLPVFAPAVAAVNAVMAAAPGAVGLLRWRRRREKRE